MTKIGRMIFEDGLKRGKEEGKEEGKKQGREEGREEGMIQTAEKMLKKNYEIEDIMEITNLTKEDIEEIQKRILQMV